MFPAEVVLLPRPLTTGGGLVPGQQTKLTKTNQSDRTLNCSSFPTVYSASARPHQPGNGLKMSFDVLYSYNLSLCKAGQV